MNVVKRQYKFLEKRFDLEIRFIRKNKLNTNSILFKYVIYHKDLLKLEGVVYWSGLNQMNDQFYRITDNLMKLNDCNYWDRISWLQVSLIRNRYEDFIKIIKDHCDQEVNYYA